MAKTIGQLTQATTLAGGEDFIIEQSGLTKRVAASVVRGGLIDADIDAAAAIAFSKLAALDSANLLVGNGSNVATKVAVTGDVTISNAGVTAIGSAKVTPTMLTQPLTLATAQNTTSGTSIDFTGIPSWVKRITVLIAGLSTSGSSNVVVRVGTSTGINSSGYVSGCGGNGVGLNSTDGWLISPEQALSYQYSGAMQIVSIGGNAWVCFGSFGRTDGPNAYSTGGQITIASTLDRIRLTTVNGTDTFDAGSVNIMYEG
jgi:hypothetical protein